MNLIFKTARHPNKGYRIKSNRIIEMWSSSLKAVAGDIILTLKTEEPPKDSEPLNNSYFKEVLSCTRTGREVCIYKGNETSNEKDN